MSRIIRRMSAGSAVALMALTLALGGLHGRAYASDPPANDAAFELDVNPGTPELDTTRGVPVGSGFNVTVLTTTTDLSWEGYQITLDFNDDILDPVAPGGGWAVAPVEGANGGNVFAFTSGTTCTPASQEGSVFLGEGATSNFAMTCTETTSGTEHTGEGALAQFAFTCATSGTAQFTIRGAADTFLLDSEFNQYNNHVHNGSVECGGTPAPTATPGAATATPAAAATPVPGGTQPTTTAPTAVAATPSGSVTAPDTGAGSAAGGTSFALLSVALVAAGVALGGAGLAFGRRRLD